MKNSIFLLSLIPLMYACGNSNSSSNNAETDSIGVICEETSFDTPNDNNTQPTTSYEYSVQNRSISTLNDIKKVSYIVEIPSEYSEYQLDEIADVIKFNESIEYVFIEYYMKGQPRTGTNYAISKRTPSENSTVINYIAPPAEPEVKVDAPYKNCKVYGAWNMSGAKVIAYQKNGKCYMVNYYGGSNYGDPERYIKTSYRGHTAFKNADDPNDMYVINEYGDLDGYYEGDLACTFAQTTY